MVKLRLALVGGNIQYSRSPEIFAAVFQQEDVVGEYEVCSVETSKLEAAVERLIDSGVTGFSVTTPHKESIIALLDEVDPVARTIGAVNCVGLVRNRLMGYNTDWSGFAHALEPHARRLEGCPALVIGTGGAARAVIYALWRAFDVVDFRVASRSSAQVADLKNHFEELPGRLQVTAVEAPVSVKMDPQTVFNCTPLGGPNFPEVSTFAASFDWSQVRLYCDLNYNRPNRLIDAASAAGCTTLDGSAMLVAQALDAYEIWTGRRVRFEPVYQAVFGSGYVV